jgi:hypothetical protein
MMMRKRARSSVVWDRCYRDAARAAHGINKWHDVPGWGLIKDANNDEPRDDHGRWTSGGGGGVTSAHASAIVDGMRAAGIDNNENFDESVGEHVDLVRDALDSVDEQIGETEEVEADAKDSNHPDVHASRAELASRLDKAHEAVKALADHLHERATVAQRIADQLKNHIERLR